MAISNEGKIGIGLGLLTALGTAIVLIAPDSAKPVGWILLVIAVAGIVLLAIYHGFDLWRDRRQPRGAQKMFSYAGIIACAIGFLGFSVWHWWPTPKTAAPAALVAQTPPTLFSLFMNDLKPQVGMVWNASYEVTVTVGDHKQQLPVFYNIYDDFSARSKYVSFYVPIIFASSLGTDQHLEFQVVENIAETYRGSIDDIQKNRWAEMGQIGTSNIESTAKIPFSGRVYVYHAKGFTVDQIAALTRLFRKKKADVQFRGMEYAASAWQSIQLGQAKPPPVYEVRDGKALLLKP